MKPAALTDRSTEIELKLALPTSDPLTLARRLARSPLLARRKASHLRLHNVYYDSPEQNLRQQRVALRIRRKGSETKPQWLQTLKIGGAGDSALSKRGEWEVPVPSAALVLDVLEATPWERIDPDGSLFQALGPCFVTTFDRTTWLVRRRDGSVVEVALDIGQVTAGDKSAPICELELELLAGQPQALFDIARQIASSIALLPLHQSKSERGYALAQDAIDKPLRAQPPVLTPDLTLPEAARRILREMFCQFTSNLNALRTSDDPEVVHQARVGWRRFRSAWRLFKSSLVGDAAPSWQSLQPLMGFLGELRDQDVALTETLPLLTEAYVAGDIRREEGWRALELALQNAATLQRKAVRYALEDPTVGATLLATAQWLEGWSDSKVAGNGPVESKLPLRRWVRRRIDRLHDKLQQALKEVDSVESQHRARILAKRVRYGIEALRTLLPKSSARRRYQQATRQQTRIGAARDYAQAGVIAAKLEADRGLVEFLRGVAAGQERRAAAKLPHRRHDQTPHAGAALPA